MSWDDGKQHDPGPRGDKSTGVAVIIGVILWLLAIIFSGSDRMTIEQASAAGDDSASYTDVQIEREADFLAGRNVRTSCASTEAEWSQTVVDTGFPPNEGQQYVYAFTYPQAGRIFFSPRTCVGFLRGFNATYRRLNRAKVAWAVDVIVHEAIHARTLSRDEAYVEACAAKGLAAELRRVYNIRFYTTEMRALTLAALNMRRQMPPAYQGGRCT